MNKIRIVLLWCVAAVYAQNEPFALGADISWIQQKENSGTRYYHDGQAQDMLAILKEHGFNYIRLRLFVDPKAGVPEDSAKAKAEANGGTPWYASPYSTAGYCGLDSTIKMAKRVKAAGMKFLLDFHYSDTWADPGKQFKPMSWRGLNFTELTAKVRSYTKESLEKFRDNDVLPDMVQIGNEVVGGMIHPDGSNSGTNGWANFATLVNAGINGVKDVSPDIKIMMHTISERNPNSWLTTLKTRLNAVETNAANKVDVLGLSYYPKWHGDLDSLKRVLNTIANNHDIKIAVVEYADKHREVNDLVFALSANKRFGTFVWEPQEFEGDNSLPLFDWQSGTNSGRYSNARLQLYPQMAIDYDANPSSSSSSSLGGLSSSSLSSSSSSSLSSSSAEVTIVLLPHIAVGNQIEQVKNGINLQATSASTVEIFDMSGKIKARFVFAAGTYNISLAHLPKGVYIAKVKFGAAETKTKIIRAFS